jgi:hypothetical protein
LSIPDPGLHSKLNADADPDTNLLQLTITDRVVDPYTFFTDPDPELDVGGQYGSGSGSNTDPGL